MFIVIYDDEMGVVSPLQWDADCEGAIHCWCGSDPIAVFPDRKAARKAIAVSEAWNRLLAEWPEDLRVRKFPEVKAGVA